MLRLKKPKHGLDLNRNFPSNWRQEFEQQGAGPFPTSEPEVRAVAQFVVGHPNITGGVAFHTWSGVLLRPFDHLRDDEMHPEDLWHYRRVGAKGTELTGYPAISVFEEFRYHPKQVIGGAFDWIYEHLGMFSWVVEIWSPMKEAGIRNYKYIDWFRDHPIEDDLKLYHWSRDQLGGIAHIAWKPFDHPQLGRIEIGGWNRFHAFGNPPPAFLERELARFPKWLVWQALTSPKMELLAAEAEALADDHWRVRLVVQNTGWLPSYVSKRAQERKVVRGVIAEIALPDGRRARARQAARGTGPARGQVGEAHRGFVLARLQRHRRPREGRVGRAWPEGRPGFAARPTRARGNRARHGDAGLTCKPGAPQPMPSPPSATMVTPHPGQA